MKEQRLLTFSTLLVNFVSGRNVIAVVTRTGFNTKKGNLVRSILFPKEVNLSFYTDSYKFLAVLAILAVIGYLISLPGLLKANLTKFEIFIHSLDLVTITVPPSLSACLAVGLSWVLMRIKGKGIFCTAPTRINAAGRLSCICLDKTGTLTQDYFVLDGVMPREGEVFGKYYAEVKPLQKDLLLIQGMAVCHSVALNEKGKAIGDPLEVELLKFTEWQITEFDFNGITKLQSPFNSTATILKRFSFNFETKRMSVIAKIGNGPPLLFTKGAPDSLKSLCLPITCPYNYNQKLLDLSSKGLRPIAFAYKVLNEEDETKEELELVNDLQFLGWAFFANLVKPETTPTIQQLHDADIETIMVTGDYQATANAVAKECRILKEDRELLVLSTRQDVDDLLHEKDIDPYIDISVNESAFTRLAELEGTELGDQVFRQARVYSRMTPEQKANLVEILKRTNRLICMCGDGANDCVALNTADVGISISLAEASIAAPFTSQIPNISCVTEIIKEGRGGLVTTFQTFKFIIIYSFIQFSSTFLTHLFSCSLSDMQYTFIDLAIVFPLAITMCS
jgi:cation-transporting ATPase 13A3/4/5